MTVASKITSALLLATAVAADCANPLKPINDAKLANGWTYRPVATGFTKPRGIQFDKDGGLLVVDAKVGIFHLALTDDGDTCVSANKTTLLQSKGVRFPPFCASNPANLSIFKVNTWHCPLGRWQDAVRLNADKRLRLVV